MGRRPREHFDVAALNIPGSDLTSVDSTKSVNGNVGVHGKSSKTKMNGAVAVDLSTPVLGTDHVYNFLGVKSLRIKIFRCHEKIINF